MKKFRYYWEDFPVGTVLEFGGLTLTKEEIVRFAKQYDPQPFHVDEEAAKRTVFGELIASGWQTCAAAMRMMCDAYLLDAASAGAPGRHAARAADRARGARAAEQAAHRPGAQQVGGLQPEGRAGHAHGGLRHVPAAGPSRMRHPVSSSSCGDLVEALGATVRGAVVRLMRAPAAPENTQPGAGEDADGVRVIASAAARPAVDVGRPDGAVARVVGETGERLAKALVAREAEGDSAMLARGVSDGCDAGLGGELVVAGEAGAVVTQLGEDLGGVDAAGTRQRSDDWPVWVRGDGVLDGRRELGELRNEGLEDPYQRAYELALGLRLGLAAEAGGCAPQACEKNGQRAAAAVAVLSQELGEAFLAEPLGGLRSGVAVEEGERDRRIDVGEDGGCARPEALEQRAQLVGERDALLDEVVAGANECPQGARLVGERLQRTEPVSVGAQQVGEYERVAGVALALGRGVARPRRLEGVGMDGHDREPSLDEGIDEQPGGTLDGHPQIGCELSKLATECIQDRKSVV